MAWCQPVADQKGAHGSARQRARNCLPQALCPFGARHTAPAQPQRRLVKESGAAVAVVRGMVCMSFGRVVECGHAKCA